MPRSLCWDVFCRVIDNHGDAGVCWRLACDLARRGVQVRLWIDDPSPLRWMAPKGHEGVDVIAWTATTALRPPCDVVVEAFGCQPPDAFVETMAALPRPPVWINLEYLSAEPYVERSHGLPSPQLSGPGVGLTKWFFYPGFTPRTGGLLHEPDLALRQAAFAPTPWLASHGIERASGERLVTLFCYDNPRLDAWLDVLAAEPTLLLATAGAAARQVEAILGPAMRRGGLRARSLPLLTQRDYDHLLWCADLNFVRGEDSFVRAQWAGVPFVWQIYPQDDGAHAAKLDAFCDRFLAAASPALAVELRSAFHHWNGLSGVPPRPAALLGADAAAHCRQWRETLLAQPDLVTQLLDFAARHGGLDGRNG